MPNNSDQMEAEENKIQQGEISVEISPDLLFKHPLEHTWSFWYYENNKEKSWEENQKEVTSFNTVEDFWCLHNFIKPASQVKYGCDYSIFKKGIRPMWEDKMNEKGGRWIVKFDSRPRDVDINKIWLDIILLIIGGELDDYRNEVCGAILNVRSRCDKIALWTPNVNKTDEILGIGRKVKDCLNYEMKLKLNYESHESVEKKSSKNRYLHCLRRTEKEMTLLLMPALYWTTRHPAIVHYEFCVTDNSKDVKISAPVQKA